MTVQEPGPSSTIEQIVSEAVCKVLRENGQLLENFDASKIMELVGQQKLVEKAVEQLNPVLQKPEPTAPTSRNKNHKSYSIPEGTPAYTPTPIAVLKKKVHSVPAKVENYVPTDSSGKKPPTVIDYKPSKVSPVKSIADTYCPSGYSTKPSVDYTPSIKGTSNAIDDRYTPPTTPADGSLSSKAPVVVDYKPSKVSPIKSTADSYFPSGYSGKPDVDYTPSSRDANYLIDDRYTPPSINSDTSLDPVSYEPTTCEFSSSEPTYSPSCLNALPFEDGQLDYSPSSITSLTSEPTYCPVPSSSQGEKQQPDYTPSKRDELELTMEQLFDMPDETLPQPNASSNSSSSRKRSKDKEREKEKERRREKEKREKEKKSKHSSSKKSSKPSKRAESDSDLSDVDEECYRIFKVF